MHHNNYQLRFHLTPVASYLTPAVSYLTPAAIYLTPAASYLTPAASWSLYDNVTLAALRTSYVYGLETVEENLTDI